MSGKVREWWLREPKEGRRGSIIVATPVAYPYDVFPPMSGSYWLRKNAFKVVSRDDLQPLFDELKECVDHANHVGTSVIARKLLKAWEGNS
jgi:hypothetical protein